MTTALRSLLEVTTRETTRETAAAGLPPDHVEAHRLFDVAGDARVALDTLQDTIARECFGAPDRLGLCGHCGKVVDRSGRSGHDPGGCLSIIAEPVVALVRIPKRLWLRGRWHLRRASVIAAPTKSGGVR